MCCRTHIFIITSTSRCCAPVFKNIDLFQAVWNLQQNSAMKSTHYTSKNLRIASQCLEFRFNCRSLFRQRRHSRRRRRLIDHHVCSCEHLSLTHFPCHSVSLQIGKSRRQRTAYAHPYSLMQIVQLVRPCHAPLGLLPVLSNDCTQGPSVDVYTYILYYKNHRIYAYYSSPHFV